MTIQEYRENTPECTGEFVGQDGDILPDDAVITISDDGTEWCAGEYDGTQTWEPLT
jgi:hypothetical protein